MSGLNGGAKCKHIGLCFARVFPRPKIYRVCPFFQDDDDTGLAGNQQGDQFQFSNPSAAQINDTSGGFNF